MTNKTTKATRFNAIATILGGLTADAVTLTDGLTLDDLIETMTHEVELLNKKAKASKDTLTKIQKANELLKGDILSIIALADKGMTATEIADAISEGKEDKISCQKVSALTKQMVDTHTLERVKEGKRSVFVLAE